VAGADVAVALLQRLGRRGLLPAAAGEAVAAVLMRQVCLPVCLSAEEYQSRQRLGHVRSDM
jgi:hypothetical protein